MPMTIKDDFFRYVCQTSPFSNALEVSHALGCYIYGTDGRDYLDFIAGIAVNSVGHSHPAVVEAVKEQVSRYAHTMVYGEHVQLAQVELAKAVAGIAPQGLDTTYFLSTGAEANDAALKMAVKLTGRRNLVAFEAAYHGDTVGALSCFGDATYRNLFQPLLPRVTFLSFGDTAGLEAITEDTAGVIVEPVQGEGGIIIPSQAFLLALRERCNQTGAMLIFDEVQTGFGRLGSWFGASHFGVTPDIMTVAKGFGAGLPLAGVIGPHDQMHSFASLPPFSHITTFGGNPVCCAAGLAALRVIQDGGFVENAKIMGSQLLSRLEELARRYARIEAVRGLGLMIGIQLDSGETARSVVQGCQQRGMIIESLLLSENTVRFSPPLIVAQSEVDRAMETFESTIAALS